MISSSTNGGNEEPNGHIPLHISSSQRGLISDSNPKAAKNLVSIPVPKRTGFFNIGSLASPSLNFQKLAEERDAVSRAVPSSSSLRETLSRVFHKKIDWGSLLKLFKEWIRNPMNMVLFVWIIVVAISGAILFLVMTGMLDAVLRKKSQRDAWFEVNNQILNALFTLMCLYQHPKRIYHLVLLVRWRPEDISRLRNVYCKNGTYKPHEWAHMMLVVSFLHLNCFAQYALCALNVGYRRSNRPAIGVAICISVAIGAPAIAGIYTAISPLGKEYHLDQDEESQVDQISRPRRFEKTFSFASRDEVRIEENRPKWNGGIFDFWDDISSAYLSLFCTFCVFGWNMERLGFGNMYVHIVTFLLFCTAPFWIFNLAAVNIDNEIVREALGVTGIFLCVFGLLYGGFWRIQMRKRFNLPPNNFCCGKPAVTDCALWLFCCWCSLSQEVRTVNFYDIVEDKLLRKKNDELGDSVISPLPRENGEFMRSSPSSPSQIIKSTRSPSPSRFSRQLSFVEEESLTRGKDETMVPPVPSLIHRDDN